MTALKNENFKNQKFASQWGEIVCDAEGICIIKDAEAAQFFLKQKGWKELPCGKSDILDEKVEAEIKDEAPKVEPAKEEKPRKWSRSK